MYDVHHNETNGMSLDMEENCGGFCFYHGPLHSSTPLSTWEHGSCEAGSVSSGFKRYKLHGVAYVWFPAWFPVLCTVVVAATPWLRWRFTTRTLLIATSW
jgi:hypothetical protein